MFITLIKLHPRSNATQPDANLGVLLIEFFELYGWHFRYETTAIVIRQGGKYLPKWEVCISVFTSFYVVFLKNIVYGLIVIVDSRTI